MRSKVMAQEPLDFIKLIGEMDIHNIALNETLLENELVILNNNEKTLLFKRECAH